MNNVNIVFDSKYAYCAGDIHGNFNSIITTVMYHEIEDSVIVCCGDIGLGFYSIEYYKSILKTVNKELKRSNVHVVFLRGNHDNPEYFISNKLKRLSNIHIVPDYTVVSAGRFNILCIGGAISVDRIDRIRKNQQFIDEYCKWHNCTDKQMPYDIKQCYWPDESPKFNKELLHDIIQHYKINVVCTHTCPSFCQPITKNGIRYWMDMDIELEKDLNKERNVFNQIFEFLNEHKILPEYWCYGHFHFHNQEIIENVHFYLLDMEHNNLMDIIELR